ncbi:venom allergen 5-like [Belonocnema kinseyi]|uniref:venom allergen 5-like n=1 Tax=Belonocnema kinseyi TaxID=2817044 RepID=UPI00143D4009|nr:venom allergen 5-like [Belonocnema kinseyi]
MKNIFNRFKDWKILIFFLLKGFFVCNVQGSVSCPDMEVLETGKLNCEEIMEILNVHNEIRQSIAKGLIGNQPRASNMREMYWDEELANGAQKWANNCTFGHNSKEEREVARFKVGQNIAQTKTKRNSSDAKEFGKQINKWFDEHQNFNFGPIKSNGVFKKTGHYTQVIWANSYMIGCGYSRFRNQKGVTYHLYICHYGPSGNEKNESPYKIGRRKCPTNWGHSKKYPNLCSLKKHPPNVCEEKKLDKTDRNKLEKFSNSRRFLQAQTADSTEIDTGNMNSQKSETELENNVQDAKINIIFVYINKFIN